MAAGNLTGQTIKGYTLQERIGTGGFGAVYRAYQAIVERDVAIKVILPEFANQPDFIRRFESEAQIVAQLDHLHIVPLFDFWREPNGAFLVMRWLRGGSLHQSLKEGPWTLTAIARLLDQMATALAVAHRQGIVHRDIKPANILLDDEQNAYLTDFGIAKRILVDEGKTEAELMGSPAYMSPEQITGAPLTPQTDIYSLGIVIYEMLTGRIPFATDSTVDLIRMHLHEPVPALQLRQSGLPPQLNEVIWRATSKVPDHRYPDTLSLAADFRRLITLDSPRPQATLPVDSDEAIGLDSIIKVTAPTQAVEGDTLITEMLIIVNPYKGLRAFSEADASHFFGRDALIERLLARLEEPDELGQFLAVIGPSGSGKSSVVRAGVIPALREGALPESDNWFIVTMVPGTNPFDELEKALLRVAVDAPLSGFPELRTHDQGLLNIIDGILPDDETELVIFIDQFEEVFTQVEDEDLRAQFLKSLVAAVAAPDSRLRIIITLRADFYDRPLLYPGFGNLVRHHTEVVLPLSRAEYRQAIVEPARHARLSFENGLVDHILDDVTDQPGALPLLQYALTDLYERRTGSQLTQASYIEIGGVSGALAQRAETLYQELDDDGKTAVRQLLLRLVTLGEGAEDTRRRVTRSELKSIGHDPAVFQTVIDSFGQYRLLTFDRDPATREPTIEVAHEALLREWVRFKEWINDNRDFLRLQRNLAAAVRDWLNANRDRSYLATGQRLAQYGDLISAADVTLTQDEIDYLQASERLRQRNAHLTQAVIAVLTGLLILAIGFAIFAVDRQAREKQARIEANEQAHIAQSRELSVSALTNLDQLDRALLLSLGALDKADTLEARNSLLTALQSAPYLSTYLHGNQDRVRTVSFSPTGEWVVSGGRDATVRLWNTRTNQPHPGAFAGHTGYINSIAFSPDGNVLTSASADQTVRLWDVATGDPIGEPLTGTDVIWSVAVSPDGHVIAAGQEDGHILRWDAATGDPIGAPLAAHTDIVFSVAFSPDGRMLASAGGDNIVRLWDAATGDPFGEPLADATNWLLTLAFSPDGQVIAAAGVEAVIWAWDVTSQQVIGPFPSAHEGWIRSIAFKPDGMGLMTGSADNTVQQWQVFGTGATMFAQPVGTPLAVHRAAVWGVAYSPDGQMLASASEDGSVLLWSPTHPPLEKLNVQDSEATSNAALSLDGTRLAVAGTAQIDGVETPVIRLRDAQTGEAQHVLTGHSGPITSLVFSPDSTTLFSGSADRSIMKWDVATGEALGQPLLGHGDVVWSVAISPDGKLLASSSDDRTIILWDADTGQPVCCSLTGHTDGVLTVAFSPDGRMLASSDFAASIRLWDVASREPIGSPLDGHTDAVLSVQFDPTSQILASGSRDGTIRLWDVASQQPLQRAFEGHTSWVTSIAFSPDGRTLVSGGRDTQIRLWDVSTGTPIGHTFGGHADWVNSVTFSADGQTALSASRDGTTIMWRTNLSEWRTQACHIANRNLDLDEWSQYLHGDEYKPYCTIE